MPETTKRLSGNQSQVVDSKNRLVLPAKFREILGSTVKVGLFPQGNYFVLTICAADVYARRMAALETRAASDPALADTITFIDATTEEVDLDDQGRMTLAGDLKGYAGIERDVVVIGRGDHLQVWTAGRWEEFRKTAMDGPQGMRASIFGRPTQA
jgi:MraZ protein